MRTIILFIACLCLSAGVRADQQQELPREIVANGVEFILVPGGWFWHTLSEIDPKTGNALNKGSRELKVWVDTYYIGKYEARARDLERFMNSGASRYATQYGPQPELEGGDGESKGCSVRREPGGKYYQLFPEKDLPATHLSWDIANEWSQWMGFRLPTDAEWVRAFRGDDKRIYPWGDDYPDDTFAGFQEGGTVCNVRPVTMFPKGRSPYGVYNMAGNVYEYVADWYNVVYLNQLQDGARNPFSTEPHLLFGFSKPLRMLRGARWASGATELMIYSNRDYRATDESFACYGTRFALDVAKVRAMLDSGAATVVH